MTPKTVIPPVETPDIPETVSINGVDYSLEEAQSYIEKGKQTSELEKQWNTSVDKVWPEYGKTREELKTIQQERDEARAQLAEFNAKKDQGTETAVDVKEAQEAARKLGIVLNDDLSKQGYIKKDELDEYLKNHDKQREEVAKLMSEADGLETEINGSDGRPSFNKKAVLAYAAAYNIRDLKEAYEDMNKGQLDKWKENQINANKSKGLKTFGTGGKKEFKETKVTDDNVNDLLKESLYGGQDAT